MNIYFEYIENSQRNVNFSIIGKNYIKRIGEIKDLDFANDPKAAQDYINGKVKEATHGVIDDIVGSLDSNTLSIIVSGKSCESTTYGNQLCS